jgi:hypothetical protein
MLHRAVARDPQARWHRGLRQVEVSTDHRLRTSAEDGVQQVAALRLGGRPVVGQVRGAGDDVAATRDAQPYADLRIAEILLRIFAAGDNVTLRPEPDHQPDAERLAVDAMGRRPRTPIWNGPERPHDYPRRVDLPHRPTEYAYVLLADLVERHHIGPLVPDHPSRRLHDACAEAAGYAAVTEVHL